MACRSGGALPGRLLSDLPEAMSGWPCGDARTLAIGDNLGRVTLWDLPSRTRWVLQAARANSFQFSPDGTILAVASHGGEVRLWEVADRSLVPRWRLVADRADGSAVAFTPDGRTLAIGGQEGKVVLWDLRTGRQLGPPLVGHARGVASSAFSPDGRLLATVDGEAMLWDVASHKQLGPALPIRSQGPHAVAFREDTSLRWPLRTARCWCGTSTPPPGGARLRCRRPHPDPSRVGPVSPRPALPSWLSHQTSRSPHAEQTATRGLTIRR
jgi:hypothetical protein